MQVGDMNVLSLFDGLGGGRIALDRAGIKVDNYFASEIDKYAITVAKHNYPDIIHLGDVRDWRNWDLPKIDLLIGGSPCQSFSFAGRRNGMSTGNIEVTSLEQYESLKADGVEFDGQSYLFWEYVAVLRHYKPRWFLLENVRMAKKWRTIITRELGIDPVEINSALVSAQNRRRLYWTNIGARYNLLGHPCCGIAQPSDRKIFLPDILEDDVAEPVVSYLKSGFPNTPGVNYDKSPTFVSTAVIYQRPHGFNKGGIVDSGKSSTLTQSSWYKNNFVIRNKSKSVRVGGRGSNDRHEWDNVDEYGLRKLTPLECERLQTLPDNYTVVPGISGTQRYKMIGNGWTIDVIAYILSYLKSNNRSNYAFRI